MITILTVAIAVVALWMTTAFNQIQELEDETRDAWDRLAIELRRRHDATTELVREINDVVDFDKELSDTVHHVNSSAHETLDRAGFDHGVRAAARLQATLSEVLSQLKVTLGRYPGWHRRQRIQELLEELTGAEAASGEALRVYNHAALAMNARCQKTGWSAVARLTNAPFVEVWTDVSHTSSGPAPAILEHATRHD